MSYSSSEKMVLQQALSQLEVKLSQATFEDGSKKMRLYRGWRGEGDGPAICFLPTYKLAYQNGSLVVEGSDTVNSTFSSNHSACNSVVNRTVGRDFSTQPDTFTSDKVHPSKILISGLCK
ncbi:MAG: hypothetical protein KGQ59_02720 [Bdellovibrionales bacterium]|nr:hypothetical protein [Bdellovibrionales bacterium]